MKPKQSLKKSITALKEALASDDTDKIKEKSDEFAKVSSRIFRKNYIKQTSKVCRTKMKEMQRKLEPNAEESAARVQAKKDDDNVVDAEYEEVKDK